MTEEPVPVPVPVPVPTSLLEGATFTASYDGMDLHTIFGGDDFLDSVDVATDPTAPTLTLTGDSLINYDDSERPNIIAGSFVLTARDRVIEIADITINDPSGVEAKTFEFPIIALDSNNNLITYTVRVQFAAAPRRLTGATFTASYNGMNLHSGANGDNFLESLPTDSTTLILAGSPLTNYDHNLIRLEQGSFVLTASDGTTVITSFDITDPVGTAGTTVTLGTVTDSVTGTDYTVVVEFARFAPVELTGATFTASYNGMNFHSGANGDNFLGSLTTGSTTLTFMGDSLTNYDSTVITPNPSNFKLTASDGTTVITSFDISDPPGVTRILVELGTIDSLDGNGNPITYTVRAQFAAAPPPITEATFTASYNDTNLESVVAPSSTNFLDSVDSNNTLTLAGGSLVNYKSTTASSWTGSFIIRDKYGTNVDLTNARGDVATSLAIYDPYGVTKTLVELGTIDALDGSGAPVTYTVLVEHAPSLIDATFTASYNGTNLHTNTNGGDDFLDSLDTTTDDTTTDDRSTYLTLRGDALTNYDGSIAQPSAGSFTLTAGDGSLSLIELTNLDGNPVDDLMITDPEGTTAVADVTLLGTIVGGDANGMIATYTVVVAEFEELPYTLTLDAKGEKISEGSDADSVDLSPCASFNPTISSPTAATSGVHVIPAALTVMSDTVSPYYDTNTPTNNTTTISIDDIVLGDRILTYPDITVTVQDCTADSTNFAGEGSGEVGSAWQIDNDLRLDLMSRLVNGQGSTYGDGYYVITADIDMGQLGAPWAKNSTNLNPISNGFTPIGKTTNANSTNVSDQTNRFSGQLNCGGNTISNLYISNVNNSASVNYDGHYNGLFGVLTNNADDSSLVNIANCILANANITGYSSVGGLVGQQTGGTITGNMVSNTIIGTTTITAGNTNAGGLVGTQTGGTTTDNMVLGTVDATTTPPTYSITITASTNYAGGLVGSLVDGTLTDNEVRYANVYSAGSNKGEFFGGMTGGYPGTMDMGDVNTATDVTVDNPP